MKSRSQNLQMAVIAPITGTAAMGFSAIVPALPELANELGVGFAAIGFLQTSAALPGVLLTPFVGYLGDRLGRRRVVIGLLWIFGIFGAAGAFMTTYGALLATRLVMGVPYAGLLALTPAIVGDLFDDDARRRAIGVNTAFLTLASTVGPIIGGLLAVEDPRRAFLVHGVAIPVALLARSLPESRGATQQPPWSAGRAAIDHLRARGRLVDAVGSAPYTTAFMAVFVGFSFVVVPVLLGDLGLDAAARGPVVGAANLGSAVASVAIAATGFGRRPARALRTGQLLALSGLLILSVTRGPVLAVSAVLLMGLAIGTTYNTVQHFVTVVGSDTTRGLVVGAWSSSTRAGQVLGGVMAGAMVAAVGPRPAFRFGAAAMFLLALGWGPLRRLANDRIATERGSQGRAVG